MYGWDWLYDVVRVINLVSVKNYLKNHALAVEVVFFLQKLSLEVYAVVTHKCFILFFCHITQPNLGLFLCVLIIFIFRVCLILLLLREFCFPLITWSCYANLVTNSHSFVWLCVWIVFYVILIQIKGPLAKH